MYNSILPSFKQPTVQTMAVLKSSCRVKRREEQIPQNLVLLILFSGAKVPLFSFSEKRKKLEKGKYQKHWPHLRHLYPCLDIVLIPLFLFLETKGKISRKKKQMERTHVLVQMIRVLL